MGIVWKSSLVVGSLGLGILGWQMLWRLSRRQGAASLVPWVLMLGLGLRVCVAFGTPDFYAPDEQSHFNYVKYLAEQRSFPVQVHQTDSPTNDWEYYQPPLYYLAQVPIYLSARAIFGDAMPHGTVVALRLFSIALWGVVAWSSLQFLRALRIQDDLRVMTVVSMVSLLPAYVFLSAVINNDNLVLALGSVFLVVLARGDLSWRGALVAGLLLGLAALAKFSAVVFGVAMVAVVWYRQRALARPAWPQALAYLFMVGGLTALLLAPWLARNLAVYGSLTAESVANVPFDWAAVWPSAAAKAAIPLPAGWSWLWSVPLIPVLLLPMVLTFCAVSGIYNNVAGLSPYIGLVALVMALKGLWRASRAPEPLFNHEATPFMRGMAVAIVVNVLLVLRFGLLYRQGQGRFLFPLIMPLALFIGAGMGTWRFQLGPWRFQDHKAAHVAGFFLTYAVTFVAYSLVKFPSMA